MLKKGFYTYAIHVYAFVTCTGPYLTMDFPIKVNPIRMGLSGVTGQRFPIMMYF